MLAARSKASTLLSALLLSVFSTACDDSVGVDTQAANLAEGTATLRVLLTDAPADYIASAWVDIGAVQLVPADDEDGSIIVLSEDGTDGFIDLLELQNAATAPLAEAEIEAGSYSQLRLIVEAARVELVEGYAFRDGTTEKDLKVPSGAQTGIKLNLHAADDQDGPLEIVPGEMVLVLDFDVNQSYVLQGNPKTPAGIHGVIFKPTLRVTVENVAASIGGTVTTELDDVDVGGLTVFATPTDGGMVEGYQTTTGSAVTAEDGTYTIFFLVPGSYDVTVELTGGLATDPEVRLVALGLGESATGVDFEVIDVSGSIAGTVSTDLEESVAGLVVTATPSGEGDPLETTTGEGGVYLFESVAPGTYTVTVAVGDDRLTDPASSEVEVGPEEDVTGVDFEVIEDVTGSIAGTVTTELAVSVVGLTVTATPDGGGDPVETTTGEGGAYLFASLAADTYTVTVTVGTGLTTDPADREIELAEDEEETGADFVVVEASSS